MKKEERSWWFMTIPRGVVALVFLVWAAVSWMATGVYPRGGWMIGGLFVLAVAEVTNVLDYKYAPNADTPMEFLGGKTLREARALVDIVPLWTMGLYVFGLALLVSWVIAVIYLGVFLCCTLPQALCGLPEKKPVLSTALGRFVPVVLSFMLCLFSSMIGEALGSLEILLVGLLLGVPSGLVFAFWNIGIKGEK